MEAGRSLPMIHPGGAIFRPIAVLLARWHHTYEGSPLNTPAPHMPDLITVWEGGEPSRCPTRLVFVFFSSAALPRLSAGVRAAWEERLPQPVGPVCEAQVMQHAERRRLAIASLSHGEPVDKSAF